jgi:hypothetical protein
MESHEGNNLLCESRLFDLAPDEGSATVQPFLFLLANRVNQQRIRRTAVFILNSVAYE